MTRLLRILWRWSLLLVFLLAVAVAAEDLILRYRLARVAGTAVVDRVTVYPAAEQKSGRVEIYFDHPQVQECVHALFPHFGRPPCWYVQRHQIQLISQSAPGEEGSFAYDAALAPAQRRPRPAA